MDSTNLFLTVTMIFGSFIGVLLLFRLLKISKIKVDVSRTEVLRPSAIEREFEKSEAVIFILKNNKKANGQKKDPMEATYSFESQYTEACM